jgi:immune inhibitor A
MRRLIAGLSGVVVVAGLTVGISPSAQAAPPETRTGAVTNARAQGDELPNPREDKRRAMRDAALNDVLNGRAKVESRNGSKVVKVGAAGKGRAHRDQYVELARAKTDKIFVILAEFGDQRHPSYPDQDTAPSVPGPARFDGPVHNQIPEPDRAVDNSTVWQSDYSRSHFQNLYFGTGAGDQSVKKYYEKQSSGRYSINGQVSDWVKVTYNEARYGRSNGFPCATNVCSNTWDLIKDAIDRWVVDQKAAGQTDAQIKTALATYDKWDRYDFDADGDFNEPDGYLDHFQIVHAGGDQADGDPSQGEDAIWSHRWKAFPSSTAGPANNPDGGAQIGATGLWVADYTIQPENGGMSVFAHEYGHDLGLPDLYDTSAAGENSVNWWSIMAQSRVGGVGEPLGVRAADFGAWEKLTLGWLDYEIAIAGQQRTYALGPHEYNSAKPQALVAVLPKKVVTVQFPAPPEGAKSWWSTAGDDLDTSLSRNVTLPAGSAALTFKAWWDIEDCGPDPCDYGYVEVNDGGNWTAVPGSITKPAEGNGIDGRSAGWVPATFDLSAYAGKTVGLRFRYQTDGGAGGQGLFVDDVKITSGATTVFADGAEGGANGWTLTGFEAVGTSKATAYDNYYIMSHRNFVSYDKYLQTGPYNFGFTDTRPDWVEHFSYQEGLLISYWDTSQKDNNTSQHPGEGLVLPVDAHPAPVYRLDGVPWRPRIQGYDATFSLRRADTFTLHVNGQPSLIRGQNAVPVFDDSRQYWYAETPTANVKVPNAGVRVQVLSRNGTSMSIRLSSTK